MRIVYIRGKSALLRNGAVLGNNITPTLREKPKIAFKKIVCNPLFEIPSKDDNCVVLS